MASRVLRDVTKYKGARLLEQQARFEDRKRALLDDAEKSADPVATLLDGLEKLGFKGTVEPVCYANIRLMHKQSQHDASVPSALIRQWQNDIERLLDVKSTKYEYAALFSKLATEWVDKPNDANVLLGAAHNNQATSGDSESFEPVQVGREEMHQQRQQWDSLVFTEHHTDKDSIKRYLTDLFIRPHETKRINQTPFESLRHSMKHFGMNSKDEVMTTCGPGEVKICVKALLKADLFSGEKRDELVGLRDAPLAVLKEVSDVINMGLSSIDHWEWKPSPMPAHMRRHLNGKYRVYMEPEIHQALLIQWIGTFFAFSLKRNLTGFYRSKAWPKTPYNSMGFKDRKRASFYVPGDSRERFENSVLYTRREQYRDDFFMTQLPSSIHEGNRDYDGNGGKDSDEEAEGKSPLEVKQTLLRLATTELIVQKKLYGSFTLCRTDFKWFGPSLPHDTIFAVLEFLGVGDIWLNFFRKFLATPLIFPQDGPGAEPRMRLCGVPISHTLSDALGEAVLFCLDYAVSKATGGSCQLYRFHDDIWFWGQEKDCETAWQTITTFTEVMGLELNEEKTGSVQVGKGDQQSSVLPKGSVRWGFLEMDAARSRWVVDMKQVDEHIGEIKRQFAQCRSVFSWVQAWNSYIGSFLRNNFGHAANCLGSDHLDMVFSTFKYIQQKLFVDEGSETSESDVTSYLKTTIEKRFGAKDVANALLFWPTEFGGLDLRNPFIPLLTVRNTSMEDPAIRIDQAFEQDEEEYETAKKAFETRGRRDTEVPRDCDPETFFSYQEYVRFREETSEPLKRAYEDLMDSPIVEGVKCTMACEIALGSVPSGLWNSKSFQVKWAGMDDYWRWILQLYAGEAMDRFGGLMLGEKEYLPVELVNLMKSERVRWQG